MFMKTAHRISGSLLILFTIVHLGVHLIALAGIQAHLAALESVQWVYRTPIGEPVLILAILIQLVSGFSRMLTRKFRKWAAWQIVSGLYLLVFLFLHTSAAVFTHTFYGIETNFYWAAGSLAYTPLKYGFALYYFAAILAFFTHLAAAVRFGWPVRSKFAATGLPKLLPIAGAGIALAILIAFSGMLYPIDIPDDVRGYYEKNFSFVELE